MIKFAIHLDSRYWLETLRRWNGSRIRALQPSNLSFAVVFPSPHTRLGRIVVRAPHKVGGQQKTQVCHAIADDRRKLMNPLFPPSTSISPHTTNEHSLTQMEAMTMPCAGAGHFLLGTKQSLASCSLLSLPSSLAQTDQPGSAVLTSNLPMCQSACVAAPSFHRH